ncbi:hypothetical protein QE152_g35216 [Popillia japonica]|uniref:Uncharacterized protein n=1 Tax=Popillia japonica TaxID=7064 RepID=A0AAW1IGJ2_POPJA
MEEGISQKDQQKSESTISIEAEEYRKRKPVENATPISVERIVEERKLPIYGASNKEIQPQEFFEALEKHFKIRAMPEDRKLDFAVDQLKDDVAIWVGSNRNQWTTLEDLKRDLLKMYWSDSVQKRKEYKIETRGLQGEETGATILGIFRSGIGKWREADVKATNHLHLLVKEPTRKIEPETYVPDQDTQRREQRLYFQQLSSILNRKSSIDGEQNELTQNQPIVPKIQITQEEYEACEEKEQTCLNYQ